MLSPRFRDDPALNAEIRTMVLRSTPEDYRGQIEAALNREDQTRYLPEIRHKVLVICGEDDEWSPVPQHEEIVDQLVDAELVIIPEAGIEQKIDRRFDMDQAIALARETGPGGLTGGQERPVPAGETGAGQRETGA